MKRAVFWQLTAVFAAGIVLMVCSCYIVANNFVSLYPTRWRVNVMRLTTAFTPENQPRTLHMSKDCKLYHKWRQSGESRPINAASCQPKQRIVFLKTHKTAGGTVMSILQRYGYNRDLTFALPKEGICFPEFAEFDASFVYQWDLRDDNGSLVWPALGGFHILAHHGRYSRAAMDAVIPNATYFTILREPAAQLESAFGFYRLERYVPNHDLDGIFTMAPKRFFTSSDPKYLAFLRNGQMFDLGLEQERQDPKSVDDKIKSLNEEIDLVMISEYFDESLILLKQLLCWEFEDMVYISRHVRQSDDRKNITASLRDKIQKWNHADVKLYRHFNHTLWEKIRNYGPDFQRDLQTFRELQMAVTNNCSRNAAVSLDETNTYKYTPLTNTSKKCQDLLLHSDNLVELLRKQMAEKSAAFMNKKH